MTTVSGSPPLEARACLCRRYPSSQKGGTLIVEGVDDLAEHERRLESGRLALLAPGQRSSLALPYLAPWACRLVTEQAPWVH